MLKWRHFWSKCVGVAESRHIWRSMGKVPLNRHADTFASKVPIYSTTGTFDPKSAGITHRRHMRGVRARGVDIPRARHIWSKGARLTDNDTSAAQTPRPDVSLPRIVGTFGAKVPGFRDRDTLKMCRTPRRTTPTEFKC